MSKVEELLETYNPNGVEFDEIGKNVQSLPKEILKNEFVQQQGQYPVINSGRDIQGYYSRYNNDGDVFTVASRGESAGFIQYSATPFWAGGLCYPYRTKDNNKVSTKFLYYYLKKTEKSIMTNMVLRGGIPAINKSDFEKYKIPLPHIKVQEEIVKILDSFTNLIDALNEELSLRQKQLEYYREKLLTFDDDVEKFIVTEVAQLKSGLTYKPSDVSDKGILVLRSSNIKNGFLSYDDNVFVKESTKISDRSIVRCNDILICVRNGSKKLVGKCAMIDKNADGMAFGAFMSVLRAKDINPKYLFYVWSSQIIQDKIKGDDAAPINQITSKDFNRLLIPVPKEQIQQSIVEKLDAFESLISSLKEEIALRQKQYEYYREKLLTFD